VFANHEWMGKWVRRKLLGPPERTRLTRTVEGLEEGGLEGLGRIEELEAEEDEGGRLQQLHQLVNLSFLIVGETRNGIMCVYGIHTDLSFSLVPTCMRKPTVTSTRANSSTSAADTGYACASRHRLLRWW
jgi:hypothetical protein